MAITMNEEQVRWILYGAPTIAVASRSASMRPSLGQAIGCRLQAGSNLLTVFMLARRNRLLILDLRAGHEVAVAITRSATTRSLQVKAKEAREVAMTAADEVVVADYVETVVREWTRDGTPPEFTRRVMVTEPGPLVAFEMEMVAAFDQTPGPRAGEALRSPV